MQPSLEPSYFFEPSKHKVQILLATRLVHTLLLFTSMLQKSLARVGLQGRSSNYVSIGTGDEMAMQDNIHDQLLKNNFEKLLAQIQWAHYEPQVS